jgi:hypothetical protein
MATFEALALITNSGKARMAQLLADGKAFKIDRFVVGNQGHDPLDLTLALTPDPTKAGCYCSPESLTVLGGCSFEGLIDTITFNNTTCPVFKIILNPGQATGVVTSICLLGTIVYSPIPNDPELNTRFSFAVANFPYKIKIPSEKYEYNLSIQL